MQIVLHEIERIAPAEVPAPYQVITEAVGLINIIEVQLPEVAHIAEELKVLLIEAAIGVLLREDLYIQDLPVHPEVRDIEVLVEVLPGIPVTDRAEVLPEVPGIAQAGAVHPEVPEFGHPAGEAQEVREV
ncbi:MAG: hypothetical protein HKN89_04575 [Eudoraea sp.]|nr:hypothetical protein [Eudoraea sp.]